MIMFIILFMSLYYIISWLVVLCSPSDHKFCMEKGNVYVAMHMHIHAYIAMYICMAITETRNGLGLD